MYVLNTTSSSLLVDAEDECHVKMHDVVCEFTLRVAREHHTKFAGTNVEFINWKTCDIGRRCTPLSLQETNMDAFNDDLEYSALELLIFPGPKFGVIHHHQKCPVTCLR